MKYLISLLGMAFFLSPHASASKAKLRFDALADDQDTSIVIKKGDVQTANTEYEIVEGKEEIFGSPGWDRSQAYTNWKTACTEWKQSMREMNKENLVLSLHCSAPNGTQQGDQWVFAGASNYKLRVKLRERAK